MSTTKNKVMMMTDSSLRSGFGNIAHNIATGLVDSGQFEVGFLGWGFHYEAPLPRGNYTLLPTGNDAFGADVLGYYLQTMKPEALFVQADCRMVAYLPALLKQIAAKPSFIFYPVIDGSVWTYDGKAAKWPSNWLQIIKAADKVVTMTKFGQRILEAEGVECKTIYHGVDTSLFKPAPPEFQASLKQQIGVSSDTFVFGGVFKNMQRKCPEKYLQAFKIFYEQLAANEREKVALLLHTNPQQATGAEFDLGQQAIDYGLTIGKNVIFSNPVLPPNMMPYVYQTMDAFIHLGTMEGFGVPIIEAMSCGLPSVAVDSCTMPELFADSALITDVAKTCKGRDVTVGSYNGVEMEVPDQWDVAKKMMQLYKSEGLRKELGMKATERAMKTFSWEVIKPQWIDLFKSCVIQESDIPAEWQKLMAEVK